MTRVEAIKMVGMFKKLPTTRLITIGLRTNEGKVSIVKYSSEIGDINKLMNDIEFELLDLVQLSNHTIDELDFFVEKKDYGEKWNGKSKENS